MKKKALLFAVLAVCLPVGAARGASEVSVATGATKGGRFSGANPKVFKPSKPKAVVGAKALAKTLKGSKGVTITTESSANASGDLIVSAPITKTGGPTTTLTLNAVQDIRVNAAINCTKNTLPIVLRAGRAIKSTAAITTNGGDLTINTVEPFSVGGLISAGAGKVVLETGSLESSESQTITASLVEVPPNAAWRLHGTVTGDLTVQGVVSPGAEGKGALQVSGAVILQPNAVIAINLGGLNRGTNYGSITAIGAVNLAGSLQLDCIDGFEDQILPGHTFTILTAGTITGTFSGLENGSRVFLPDELGSLKITYTTTGVTLSDWQPIIIDQPWDPGLTDEGTLIYTNTRTRGKRHYFRVHTQDTDIGAWRSRLNPPTTGGEADLYALRGALPSTTSWQKRSANPGADGFVLNNFEFQAGQEWFLLVYADAGTAWNFVTGRAFVHDIGQLQWTDTNASGTYDIGEPVIPSATGDMVMGGEGMRFYKATVPTGTPAWSLWLGGSDKDIAVRRSVVPFHTAPNLYDRKQAGQMLVVPPYLGTGAATYFLSVVGKPGDAVNLDSRIQEVTDTAFNTTVPNVSVPDAPYRVYRVQVPVDQIAWDVSTVALNGDPNVAVRRTSVPAEFDNDGFSEVAGDVSDSVTLVPNFLTNGTWFITVYGKSPYSFTLRNGPPEISPIQFTDQKLNDRPFRVGWQFYALTDVPSQLGSVGWELQLANHVAGTEIAIRRNAVPSRWRSRVNGLSNITVTAASDVSSVGGILQNPGHQADIWYVGVFLPTQPLGPFVLSCRPIEPPTIAFDGGAASLTNLEPGTWSYVRVNVPAGAVGWDVRLRDVVGGNPAVAVRRDLLPALDSAKQLSNLPGWTPSNNLTWPTGNQWLGGVDWTGQTLNGVNQPVPNRLVMGMSHPLEAGTYYVGFYNSTTSVTTNYTVDSRGIGDARTYPVTSIDYNGGTAPIVDLPPREPLYFKVNIPPDNPSWELILNTSVGDAELVVRRGAIPDFAAVSSGNIYEPSQGLELEMVKTGPERYVLLPPLGASVIPSDDYYIAVVSQGVNPSGATIGSGTSSATLTSAGPLSVLELGTPDETGITHPVSLLSGQVKAYHFDVPADAQSLEVRLANRVGDSGMVVLPGPLIPTPTGSYGHDGGNGGVPSPLSDANALVLTAPNPVNGKWSIVLNAGVSGDATATLIVKVLGVTPLGFDGGTAIVTGHQPATVRYFSVDVPEGAEGWDVRMTDLVGPVPTMVVRRDYLTGPVDLITPGWMPWADTTWPSGYQTRAGTDWTGYTLDPGGLIAPPRLVSGMGRPLQPGRYYIGVTNGSTSVALNYKIKSYGIGTGFTYPVTALDFANGTASIEDLASREARYFKVQIPPGAPSWEVTLSVASGELELLTRQGSVPDFAATTLGSVYVQNPFGCEAEMKKTGPERYVLLPLPAADFLPPGDYYLAAVGEGTGANLSTIGTGVSSGTLSSGPLAVTDLGTANATGTIEPVQLASAQLKAYRFIVPPGTDSLEVRLDNAQGNPWVSLAQGARLPTPPGVPIPGAPQIGSSPYNEYGTDGGNNSDANTRILTVANPTPGEWRAIVRAGHGASPQFAFNTASADLVVTALSTVPLAFDGGMFTINGQQPGTWRYFAVEVPGTATGWDVRLRDVQGPIPAMMVRRDLLPSVPANLIPGFIPLGWLPWTVTSWPTGNQWLAGVDWTGYALDAAGVSVPPRLVMGMKQPLEAGTYLVGIYNNTVSPTSYSVESRGIGQGLILPVTDLAFTAGTANVTELPRREAQYFKVSIPPNTPSWEVSLVPSVGELGLLCRAGSVPDFAVRREGSVYTSQSGVELKMQKAGSERYVLLPNSGQDFLPAGDYYLAVVSEGVNPGATIIGTGNSSGIVTSLGTIAVKSLGTANIAATPEPVTLAGGQVKAYQFSVEPGTESLEVRLEGTVGYPAFSLVQGTRLPIPPGASPLGTFPHSEYGFDGGTGGNAAAVIHTIANPGIGPWSLLVRAGHDPAFSFPDAAANLVIRRKPNISLNFAEALNPQGGTNTDTRQAIDGEYNIYQVAVPPAVAGQSVLGWVIQTEVFQGAVSLQVYKDFSNPAGGITIPTGVAIVVPPFLTVNDTWYVRVKATGLTNYRITSRPVTLERPTWQMPNSFNSIFGDSGNDSAGNPLPGDRGTDLQQGYWHFYAVDVPTDNLGLLRTELQAISGNPDLYIREDGVPTIHHYSNGSGGVTLAPRSLTGATTSYGNWVPFDGRTENRLRPGRWYIGVRAGGNSNVRYRLIVSSGTVKDLALDASSATAQQPNSVTGQTLADNDWRYYRFVVPQAAPKNWTITFGQQVGDVIMWLRDTVPPGQKDNNTITSGHVASWYSDNKNQGPYLDGYDAAGAYTFTTPPLRPGHVYYVGMRSNNSATFSVSSDTSGGPIVVPPALDFYSGSLSTTIPANDSLLYRIPVPPEATRMKYSATHSLAIKVRLEQGTLAAASGAQHLVSSTANSTLNQALSTSSWPWLANQTYYVRFVNTSAVDEAITFTLNGKNAQTEDEDNDTLPDAWERQYFTNLGQTAAGDPDNDSVSNATELADGTAPNDGNSAKYTLTVLAKNGTAGASPNQAKYDKGTVVTLSNVPAPGYAFVGWSGGPFRGDDFAIKATGTITIPTAGTWTFGINSADGARLKINGAVVLSDNATHEAKDSFGQIGLAAGTYPLEVVAFERSGGESLELFAALGTFTTFNPNFKLVGDVPNGGLLMQTLVSGVNTDGFTVRQVEASTATINSLLAADNLLSGASLARQDITGVIDVLNFLTYYLSDGHFADNVQFPFTSAIEDNPLSLTMSGNYVMAALNSIPLAEALDSALAWHTGSNVPWLGENDVSAFDTVDAAGSGPIADNQSSSMQTTVTGPGVLTFKWRVSSLSGDNLAFIVDGNTQTSISGETTWATRTYNVATGVHTLTWQYSKNATGSAGSDRGWLDQVVFTPQ